MKRIQLATLVLGIAFLCFSSPVFSGEQEPEAFRFGQFSQTPTPFHPTGRWSSTSSGSTGSLGDPVSLTWSIVPNGTALPGGLGEPASPSNLVSFLDGVHHGGASPGGADLTQRDWFSLVQSSFDRWDQISGISFDYEPYDDGAGFSTFNQGILGVRGDQRIGGHSIDGQTSPTFLAYNFFPGYSDMVIDTDEINRWSNPEGNFIRFRNMLMHEAGHGFGLSHMESSDADFLMEPILPTAFDGPQLDDILGVHRLYGDAYEENGGNDTYLDATPLGRFWPGKTKTIGADAADTVVDFTDTDFLSIDDDSDVDFFKFKIRTPSLIDIALTPLGPTYQEGVQGSGDAGTQQPFVSSAKSDLALTLFDRDGSSILEFSNDTGIGLGEDINNILLTRPGEYFVQVEGFQNNAQFYELDLDVSLPFRHNPFGFFPRLHPFDPFGPFRNIPSQFRLAIHTVPEPSSLLLLIAGIGLCGWGCRSRCSSTSNRA